MRPRMYFFSMLLLVDSLAKKRKQVKEFNRRKKQMKKFKKENNDWLMRIH